MGDDRYVETLAWLYRLEARTGIDLKLERVARAAAALGNPERRAPTFHLAGTNGKGSTAAMLAAMLATTGRRVGLFTSPHLVTFRERIVVGDQRITEDEVIAGIAHIRQVLGHDPDLTCFELITLLAWHTFAQRRVDVVVLEVGLGGRLDATNLVVPEVAVITSVDYDHQEFLGHDLATIAAEKAGIIKARAPVVSGATGAAAPIVAARARALESPLHQLGDEFAITPDASGTLIYRSPDGVIAPLTLALRGAHQQRNAALAVRALEIAPGFMPARDAVRASLAHVCWPGRLDVVPGAPLVVMDGAHNAAGMAMLTEEIRRLAAGRPVRVLFGVMRDKPWQSMLGSLATVASEIVLTRPSQPRAVDPGELAAYAGGDTRVEPDPAAAFRALKASAAGDDVVLVTGSLFLVGEVLPVVDPSLAADAERERAAARLAGRR